MLKIDYIKRFMPKIRKKLLQIYLAIYILFGLIIY